MISHTLIQTHGITRKHTHTHTPIDSIQNNISAIGIQTYGHVLCIQTQCNTYLCDSIRFVFPLPFLFHFWEN